MSRTSTKQYLALLLALPLTAGTVRIIQTNSAGDNVSIIDPSTNKVVGVINGIEVNHGAAAAPDGSRYYISNEAESTLDVVDTKSLKVTRSIPLLDQAVLAALKETYFVCDDCGAGTVRRTMRYEFLMIDGDGPDQPVFEVDGERIRMVITARTPMLDVQAAMTN